jgi:PRC-barrel domain
VTSTVVVVVVGTTLLLITIVWVPGGSACRSATQNAAKRHGSVTPLLDIVLHLVAARPAAQAGSGQLMITVGSITDWVDKPVLDRDGSKIGSMEAVYFDTSTEEPAFITVKVG